MREIEKEREKERKKLHQKCFDGIISIKILLVSDNHSILFKESVRNDQISYRSIYMCTFVTHKFSHKVNIHSHFL